MDDEDDKDVEPKREDGQAPASMGDAEQVPGDPDSTAVRRHYAAHVATGALGRLEDLGFDTELLGPLNTVAGLELLIPALARYRLAKISLEQAARFSGHGARSGHLLEAEDEVRDAIAILQELGFDVESLGPLGTVAALGRLIPALHEYMGARAQLFAPIAAKDPLFDEVPWAVPKPIATVTLEREPAKALEISRDYDRSVNSRRGGFGIVLAGVGVTTLGGVGYLLVQLAGANDIAAYATVAVIVSLLFFARSVFAAAARQFIPIQELPKLQEAKPDKGDLHAVVGDGISKAIPEVVDRVVERIKSKP